LKEEHQIQY